MIPTNKLKDIRAIVTHADCPDGLASAIILHDVYPKAEIKFISHNSDVHNNLPATEGILFCDIAPVESRVDEFVKAGTIVLDHHKTVKHIVNKFGESGIFADEKLDPGVSGAVLAYREVFERVNSFDKKVKDFARLIGIGDTWQKDNPDFEDARSQSVALMFYGRSRFLDKSHEPFLTVGEINTGRELRQRGKETIDYIIKNGLITDRLFIFNDLATGGLRYCSDVTEEIRQRRIDVDIVVGFYYKFINGLPALCLSLRTVNDTDVSKIAENNGGGGHSKAAGLNIINPDKNIIDIIKNICK